MIGLFIIAIDRSIPAMEILKEINSTIYELKRVPDNDRIIREITKIVSFTRLRKELQTFLKEFRIKDNLTSNPARWSKFVSSFIEITLDCPLVLTDPKDFKKVKPIYEDIVSKPLKHGCWLIGFSISKVPQGYFKGTLMPLKESYLSLIAFANDTTKIVIPLTEDLVFN